MDPLGSKDAAEYFRSLLDAGDERLDARIDALEQRYTELERRYDEHHSELERQVREVSDHVSGMTTVQRLIVTMYGIGITVMLALAGLLIQHLFATR